MFIKRKNKKRRNGMFRLSYLLTKDILKDPLNDKEYYNDRTRLATAATRNGYYLAMARMEEDVFLKHVYYLAAERYMKLTIAYLDKFIL